MCSAPLDSSRDALLPVLHEPTSVPIAGEPDVARLARAFQAVANEAAAGLSELPSGAVFNAELAAGGLSSTAEWRGLFYAVLAMHPHPQARCALAATGPLGLLRALVWDQDPEVRYSVLYNPLLADADVQLALASDPNEDIVVGLLERISPSAEVCRIIADGPHVRARRVLARMRISPGWLRELAHDRDLITRCVARSRLDACGELLPARSADTRRGQ